ncbi:P-loop containing nucleoside triphosphate hydrolase protein [Dioscorea alata]|uniref:P-loop containing nucleoside triphosphate hydrolase protein n=1 Tax=Dioscorea alata TaxID=55571 RepID=A0ACB7VPY1_DIOAL|nr:P-loop containing nucleoside triphosphate hydrolase protein [Dioscorea alata]
MAVVLAFVKGLCQRLQCTIAASDQLPLGVVKELQRLLKAFLAIQETTLEAAEKKQRKSKAMRTWLCELKEVAYDADDLLDCLVLKAQEPEVDTNGMEVVDQRCCLIFNCGQEHPATQTELIMIHDIRTRVQKLMRKKPFSLHLHLQRSSSLMINEVEAIETTNPNSGEFVRDEDKEKLVNLLKSDESSQVYLSLITIVGREGVGKTTLARIVYNDKEVTSYFNLKLWVTASEIYDSESLSASILSSAKSRTQEDFDDQLVAGRFLLILDDVQNKKIEWEAVWQKLQLAQVGSKILMTTENEEFVNKMRLPSSSYHLKGLSPGDCWSLFRQCSNLEAAASNQSITQLEEVGMKIVAKSEGLPLSTRLLGSVLYSNINFNDWKMILNGDIWKSKTEELHSIPAALWLSYQHLPPNIKQCFSYCSLFPLNHKFKKDNLVQMWMAEGLIQPQPGIRIEDTGSQHFIYLIQRSLLQSSEGDYMMHSLVRRLAMAATLDESLCFSGTDKSSNRREKVCLRRLSIQSDTLEMSEILDSGMLNKLRTLLFYRTISSSFEYHALFAKLKCVRVICLSDRRLSYLPESIGSLKQLRYLDVSETAISNVPDELCSLHNLQTLKLSMSFSMEPLSKCMSDLVNLRHLKGYSSNISRIHKLGKLKFLQELEEFTVMTEDGHRIEELKDMKQLRGGLCISHLQTVHTEEEAKGAKMNEKQHISKLDLYWWDSEDEVSEETDYSALEGLQPTDDEISQEAEDSAHEDLQQAEDGISEDSADSALDSPQLAEDHISEQFDDLFPEGLQPAEDDIFEKSDDSVLEGLQPHQNLKELQIYGYSGAKTPSWLQDGYLTRLLGYQSQHQLRALETLIIEGCVELVYLPDHGFSALESLKFLRIEKCMKLRYKPVANSSATLPSSLTDLKITNCAALTNDPFFMGLERLHSLSSMFIEGAILGIQEGYSPHNHVLSSLPGELLQHLMTLKELVMLHCYELENLGIQSLVSLKVLLIDHCFNLVSCSSSVDSNESLPLEFLKIERSPIDFINRKLLGRLTSLRELQIVGIIVASFSEEIKDGLHCLTSLKKLHIQGCANLQSLPDELASIPRLEELYITRCRAMESLPEMPASLVMLVIDYCSSLIGRCQRDGADWNKIENIFYVQVCGLNVKDPATPNFFDLW